MRFILAALAAFVLLTASLIPEDADARGRGGGGYRGGGGHYRGGAVAARGYRGGAVGVRGARVAGYRGYGYRGYGYRRGVGVGAAAVGAAAAYGAYGYANRCYYDNYGSTSVRSDIRISADATDVQGGGLLPPSS